MAVDTHRSFDHRRLGATLSIIWAGVLNLLSAVASRFKLTSLTRRIVAVNLLGFAILVVGHFFTNQYQAWLIDAKRASLLAQGEIIARFIATTAVPPSDNKLIDLSALDLEPGKPVSKSVTDFASLQFPIRPEGVTPILKHIVGLTGTRARIYSFDGSLIADSDVVLGIANSDGVPTKAGKKTRVKGFWTRVFDFFDRSDLPLYKDIGRANGTAYPEVREALTGTTSQMLLLNEDNQEIVSVAVPIAPMKAIKGALLLSTRGGEIDRLIEKQWLANIKLALIALIAIVVSSLLLAATIARPLRKVSQAAERVTKSLSRREELPDFSSRSDEIGVLSVALRDMTNALYHRIEAGDRFAADTAHELKNPLTSVKSAADTLGIVKTPEERQKMVDTIRYDVKRMTRLIDEIGLASKIGSELALDVAEPVDLADLLRTVVDVFNQVHVKGGRTVTLDLSNAPLGSTDYIINGHDLKLGQVVTNLLDNALSFVPDGGKVAVKACRKSDMIEILVEDEGPGIPDGKFDKIFDRFYTDRPVASFGRNSGLGLSITREIVEAHKGDIHAENITGPLLSIVTDSDGGSRPANQPKVLGARFTVHLPATHSRAANKVSRLAGWRR